MLKQLPLCSAVQRLRQVARRASLGQASSADGDCFSRFNADRGYAGVYKQRKPPHLPPKNSTLSFSPILYSIYTTSGTCFRTKTSALPKPIVLGTNSLNCGIDFLKLGLQSTMQHELGNYCTVMYCTELIISIVKITPSIFATLKYFLHRKVAGP